jgi:hypothetical protein
MNGAKMAFKIPMKMKRLRSLHTRVSHCIGIDLANYAPVNQGRSVLALQKHLPHAPPSIK